MLGPDCRYHMDLWPRESERALDGIGIGGWLCEIEGKLIGVVRQLDGCRAVGGLVMKVMIMGMMGMMGMTTIRYFAGEMWCDGLDEVR